MNWITPFIDNSYFKAGIGLLVFSSGSSLLYSGLSFLTKKVKSRLFLTIEVDSKDEVYQWLLMWFSSNSDVKKSTQLSVISNYNPDEDLPLSDRTPRFYFVPSLGTHMITFQNRWIQVSRIRDTNATDMTNGGFFESIKLTIFGTDRKIVESLFTEAKKVYYEKEINKILIFRNSGNQWSQKLSRIPRSLDSVILPSEIKDLLTNDLEKFRNSSKWYREMSIPYRRGYLLYGPPGTGKTSFVFAMAGKMKANISVLNLNEKDLRDEDVFELFSSAPANSILLLEDIDAVFFGQNDSERRNEISFSGLLNSLDGISAQEGKIVFLTTNHPEKLDPALIRPGRVDLKVQFGLASSYQITTLISRFYENLSEIEMKQFINQIPPNFISMAALQGHLLTYRSSPELAIQNLQQLLEPQIFEKLE